jgi:hypothetical protein
MVLVIYGKYQKDLEEFQKVLEESRIFQKVGRF